MKPIGVKGMYRRKMKKRRSLSAFIESMYGVTTFSFMFCFIALTAAIRTASIVWVYLLIAGIVVMGIACTLAAKAERRYCEQNQRKNG